MKIVLRIKKALQASFLLSEVQYTAFAFFGLVNFSLPAIFDYNLQTNIITLHWVGLVLCTLLLLMNYLPNKMAVAGKIFWYICIAYSLVFFSLVELYLTYASAMSILNFILSIFILLLVTDSLLFFILFLLGFLSALAYINQFPPLAVSWGYYLKGYVLLRDHYYMTCYFVWALFVSTLFLRKIDKKKENFLLKKQIHLVQAMAASITHELRTPLLSLSATLEGFNQYMPQLLQTYELAKSHKLMVPEIPDKIHAQLKTALQHSSNEIMNIHTIINILLVRLNKEYVNENKLEIFYISDCIKTAIERYPYDAANQKALIHVVYDQDFQCKAVKLLIVHILFNLIKNAIYHIKKARKGEIYIWFESGKRVNKVIFKDTGTGILKKYLPYLFEEFFSMTENGVGIGLTFSKIIMKSLKGNITVASEFNHYTLFTLSLPSIDNKDKPHD